MNTQSLRAYRHAHGLSLEKMAGVFQVHKTTVLRWEEKRVPPERVLDIESKTGIPRHDLRPDIYPPEREQEVA
jgi:DNA-binding transcriptional regulator YdaS (Cro superfamily)